MTLCSIFPPLLRPVLDIEDPTLHWRVVEKQFVREGGYGAWSVPWLPYVLRSSKQYIVGLEGCDNLSMVQVWV